jgi:hypothetical protein
MKLMDKLKQMVIGLHNLHIKGTRQMRKEYAKHFEKAQRNNGVSFIKRKEDAPEDLEDLIREIHFDHFGGCLSNDWIYATILEAFEDLENDDLENITIEADPYHTQLYKWLGEPFADELCQEAIDEGLSTGKGIYETIAVGQWLAKDRIYHAVNDFIQGEDEAEE